MATLPYYDDEFCEHSDFDLDALTGRATCNDCDHRWYASDEEIRRYEGGIFAEPTT